MSAIVVALALLMAAVTLAIAGCVAWLVYYVLEIRKEMAAADDLRDLMEVVDSLSAAVALQDKADTTRFNGLESRLALENAAGVATSARLELVSGSNDRYHVGLTSNVAALSNSLAVVDSLVKMPPDPGVYATWQGMKDRGVKASMVKVESGGAGSDTGYVEAPELRALRYGVRPEGGGPVAGFIQSPVGGGIQYVASGPPPATRLPKPTLTETGIRWGEQELRVQANGALGYCGVGAADSCITLAKP